MSILGLDQTGPLAASAVNRPLDGQNNVWHSYQNSDRCVVMVHGLGDDSAHCWFNAKSGEYWPERLRLSSAFHDYSIFLGGYETSKFTSGEHGFDDCAEDLMDGLQLGVKGRKPVLDHKVILFVCHSLGGIVTRYLLESKRERFRDRILGLALISSPSTGSLWADAAKYLAEWLGNEVVQSLQTSSLLLADLDRRFKDLRNENLLPALWGREACETKGYARLVGKIVDEESAGRYFGRPRRLAGTNHSTCVKPDSETHPAHLFLLRFIDDFEHRFASQLPERRPTRLICRRLQISVSIVNEDGDAEIELNYTGITAAPAGALVDLGSKQGAGHFFGPKLISERTSPSVELNLENGEFLKFSVAPTADAPLNVAVRRICFNAFSMDSRELALKTGRVSGMDWIQKGIDNDQFAELSFMVRFPPSMRFVGDPYLQVLDTNRLDEAETKKLARYVDYSALLGTASFFVRDPVPDRTYRIAWRLASGVMPFETSATPEDQETHEKLVRTLLWLRGLHEKSSPDPVEVAALDELHNLIGECAGLVQHLLTRRVAVNELEVSLMVVDETQDDRAPVLRLVAGSELGPGYWNLTLDVGDGNAGRAVKRFAVRVFDAEKAAKDPLKHVYKPVAGGRPHRWLMSVPISSTKDRIFAVLNIGAFQKTSVPALRTLENKTEFVDKARAIVYRGIMMIADRANVVEI